MGLFGDLFKVAARHSSRKNEGSAIYVCPKCGEKIRVEDAFYKEKYMKEELKKETKCKTCGTQMVRKSLF